MNINPRNVVVDLENDLNFSPLHQLELQMASNTIARKPPVEGQSPQAGHMTGVSAAAASKSSSTSLSSHNGSQASQHLDRASIYSFDLVSTGGRLLDRLDLGPDDYDDDYDTQSLREVDGKLSRSSSTQAPTVRANGSKLLSSLLLLGSLSRKKSARKHAPISTGLSINRTPSVPSRSVSGSSKQHSANSSNSSSSSSASSRSNSTHSHKQDPDDPEYSIGNVESKLVHSETFHDAKSIFSFQADMASLESVATISQKIPSPLSLPIRKKLNDLASNRDTLIVDESQDSELFEDYTVNSMGEEQVDRYGGYKFQQTPPKTHKHTTSLPEPNLNQLPRQNRLQQPHHVMDDLDEFQFSPSASTSPVGNTFQSPAFASTPQFNQLPTFNSTSNANKSNTSFDLSPLATRRIVSEPLVRTTSTSSSINSSKSLSPVKFPKEDLSPSARTALAIQLRNNGNHREALYQLQLAANIPHNHPKAMYLYAMALRYGQGVKLNERNSLKWLLRCLLAVHEENSNSLAGSTVVNEYMAKIVDIQPEDLLRVMNSHLQKEVEVDPISLFDYYSKLPTGQLSKLILLVKSQQNVVASTYHEVGNCLINGWGLPYKDEAIGILYLSKAASLGNIPSMTQLGEIWSSKSKYHKKDYFKASAWLRLSELFGTKSIGNSWIYKEKYIKGK